MDTVVGGWYNQNEWLRYIVWIYHNDFSLFFFCSLAAEELLASAQRQAVSASVSGPSAAYNGRKIGRVNRTFLNNTVVAALGGNRRRDREAKASAACEIWDAIMILNYTLNRINVLTIKWVEFRSYVINDFSQLKIWYCPNCQFTWVPFIRITRLRFWHLL